MKLALIHSATHSYSQLVNLCLPNHEQYAKKHGYDCLFRWDNNNPIFGRFFYAHEMLEKYDAVVIVDIDLIFMNQEIKLEDKLDNYDIVTGCDINGLNASIVITRNTEWTRDFWHHYFLHLWNRNDCPEQTTLAYRLCMSDKSKWNVLPQRELFSYLEKQCYNRDNPSAEYQDGDFCLNVPALAINTRVAILSEYLNK